MNIRKTLLKDRSKPICLQIVDYIGYNTERCKELVDLVISDHPLLHQRASWVLYFISDLNPTVLDPFQKDLLAQIKKANNHDAVKRAILRHWAEYGFLEEMEGEVYDLGLNFIQGKDAIAIKVHAMSACFRVVEKYPELAEELQIVLEDVVARYGPESAGIRSRGNRILKKLKKLRTHK